MVGSFTLFSLRCIFAGDKLRFVRSDQWKVLVYDRSGRDIISPLLNVAQLRRNGVTLHMLVRQQELTYPQSFRIFNL